MTHASEIRRKRQRGNAVIEFALGSTLLFLLLGGVSDFARLFYYANIVSNSAHAGIQLGMYNASAPDLTAMQTAALAEPGSLTGLTANASKYCQCAGTTGTVSCTSTCTGGTTPQMYLQVTTSYPFNTVVTWPSIPSTVNVSYTATARVQ